MKTATDKIFTYSFRDSFKDKLVEYIKGRYAAQGADLSRLAVVFGGRRPALFVKRDLAKCFGRSFYPPEFFTIDDFVRYILRRGGSFSPTRDLDNCFLLYRLARKVTPEILKGRETFAQFLPWTREILKFIDHLDLEDVQDRSLKNIRSNAEIGYDVPQDINRLLENIIVLREAYHRELLGQKAYSRGLQYLRASQRVGARDFNEFDQILFCNFFYFHRTEEMIVKDLYGRGKATLIFQGDQRKWPVLKRISRMFASPIEEGPRPRTPAFSLNLHAGFDAHSQVGLVREILKTVEPKDRAVIVLPDPGQIIPLLSEISLLVKDFNISMGYPLKRSSLYSLFEFVFKAQESFREGRYYAKDYLKALRHPFIKNLKLSADETVTRVLVHKVEEVLTGQEKTAVSGSLFIALEDLARLDDIYLLTSEMLARMGIEVKREELEAALRTVHQLLFIQWEEINCFQDFAVVLGRFLDVLVHKSFLRNYPLNLNIAAKIHEIKDEFQNSLFAKEVFVKEEMFRIFDHKAAHEIIAFTGSPLKGLQILGLLETRSLNFDHVIILDVNEGVLPSLRVHEPLIPREVMISLGLDRLELEEEIQRYQFMRLISSAKHVHLVYQESKDKERSRFIEELIWEEQKKSGGLAAVPVSRAGFNTRVRTRQKSVRKTPETLDFLRRHTYSASSLNMYLRNPMEFYTHYVLGLKEQEDLLDEPDARQVGTFIHEVLEESFKVFLKKAPKVDKAFRLRFTKIFEERFEGAFAKTMKSDSFLLKSVMAERLNQFLDKEQSDEQRQVEEILYLENRFEDVIALPVGDIRFRYVVDRVDRLKDKTVMIIDYKTGGTDLMPKNIEQIRSMLLSRETIRDHVRSLQIPLYFHYLNKQFPDQPINAALYNLRTLEIHKFLGPGMVVGRSQIDAVFLNVLNHIMAEILNPEAAFVEDTSGRGF
jgi:hypothetical protein